MKRNSKKFLVLALVAAISAQAFAAAPPAPVTSWELSGEFHSALPTNVNSATWQYGWKTSPTQPPTLFSLPYVGPNAIVGFKRGNGPGNAVLPIVAQNKLEATTTVQPGNLQFYVPARGVLMHPGQQCELATVRFKAPYAAQYRVSGQFYGLDNNGTKTQTTVRIDAEILNPGSTWIPLHAGIVNLNSSAQTQSSFTSKTVMLNQGEALDFAVGCPASGNYNYASTGLHAVVERVGEFCRPTQGGPNPC